MFNLLINWILLKLLYIQSLTNAAQAVIEAHIYKKQTVDKKSSFSKGFTKFVVPLFIEIKFLKNLNCFTQMARL